MRIEAGDDVFVDDSEDIVGHIRRANLRELTVYVENFGDFTLPRDVVRAAGNNGVIINCAKLPLKMRAAIGHLHGAEWAEE